MVPLSSSHGSLQTCTPAGPAENTPPALTSWALAALSRRPASSWGKTRAGRTRLTLTAGAPVGCSMAPLQARRVVPPIIGWRGFLVERPAANCERQDIGSWAGVVG